MCGRGVVWCVSFTYSSILFRRQGHSWFHFGCPGRSVPPRELSVLAGVDVSRWKVLELGALADDAFHFGRDVDRTIISPSNVKRRDSHVISNHHERIGVSIVEDETEHTAKLARKIDGRAVFVVKWKDDFAVRSGFGRVGRFEGFVERFVVVDFAVGGDHHALVVRD